VLQKIIKIYKKQGEKFIEKFTLNEIEQRIKNFSNTKDLLKTYLSAENKFESQDIPQENPIDIDKLSPEDEKKEIDFLIKNLKKINFETIRNEGMDLKSNNKISDLDWKQEYFRQNLNGISRRKRFPVKFFISEFVYSDKTKNFRKICSQFFGNIPDFKKEIDDIKIAIIIGPWFDFKKKKNFINLKNQNIRYLEWNV
jgi:hypothetical protein